MNAHDRKALYAWFKDYGRDLPWRRTADPYAILVSEFMLQQTQVATVVPYYLRWMERFPTAEGLAEASEQEVLRHWQGLGYYSRARRLHQAAREIKRLGRFPKQEDALRALPGVGDYTAAAVAAFAFDEPAAVVDANVARVLARLSDFQQPIDTLAGKRFLRDLAEEFLPKAGGRVHASAMMELGALVCLPRKPRCGACPLSGTCLASDPERLPKKRPRPKSVEVIEIRGLAFDGGQIWLERPGGARWPGLWVLPLIDGAGLELLAEIVHPIMHYRVRLRVVSVGANRLEGCVAFPVADIGEIPMPAPHRRILAKLLPSIASATSKCIV